MMADRTLWQALPGLLDAVPEPMRADVDKLRTAPYEASVAASREILRTWPFDRARVRPGLGPTIPLHCSDEFLTACRDLAREFDVGLQMHLAETRSQALLGRQKYGRTLTAHLDRSGSSARASAAPTASGSSATRSGGWPTPEPPSLTTP